MNTELKQRLRSWVRKGKITQERADEIYMNEKDDLFVCDYCEELPDDCQCL